MHRGRNIEPLLSSIKEFISYHKKVAEGLVAQGGGDGGFTEKLQGLADRLERGF